MVSEMSRRQQIESTASALFRERGYAATSIRDIARALDIQGASLYAHVASKEDVLWSIVSRAADQFDAAVAPDGADVTSPASVRLARMISAHVGVVTDDLGNASSFLHEWRFLSVERRAQIAARRDAYEARFRFVIENGMASGEMDPAVDPGLAARALLSALNGVAAWFRPTGQFTPARIADHLTGLFLDGLRRHPDAAYPDAGAAGQALP